MKLIPKNWVNFQHYKLRSPPWIKLHRNLLDDMQYQRLPVASKALAPMLWLLASESIDGVITKNIDEIAFRLRMSEKDVSQALKPLIDNGFFIDASDLLSQCYQDATSETETKTESETKKNIYIPLDVDENDFKEYLKVRKKHKKEWTERIENRVRAEGQKLGWNLQQVITYCLEKQWANFEADWVKEKHPTITTLDNRMGGARAIFGDERILNERADDYKKIA
jgi:hypothetical protein